MRWPPDRVPPRVRAERRSCRRGPPAGPDEGATPRTVSCHQGSGPVNRFWRGVAKTSPAPSAPAGKWSFAGTLCGRRFFRYRPHDSKIARLSQVSPADRPRKNPTFCGYFSATMFAAVDAVDVLANLSVLGWRTRDGRSGVRSIGACELVGKPSQTVDQGDGSCAPLQLPAPRGAHARSGTSPRFPPPSEKGLLRKGRRGRRVAGD
jgi:hypothetical protein